MLKGTLKLRNALGIEMEVQFEAENARLLDGARVNTMRDMSRVGFHVARPFGGYELPITNLYAFDFSLVGASVGKTTRGGRETWGLWFEGSFYSCRLMSEVNDPKKNLYLPLTVKFSRGARESDDPRDVEVSGEFKYVTLLKFSERKGSARKVNGWDIASGRNGLERISELNELLAGLRPMETEPAEQAEPVEADPLEGMSGRVVGAVEHIIRALYECGTISTDRVNPQTVDVVLKRGNAFLKTSHRVIGEWSLDELSAFYRHVKAAVPA